MSRQALGMGLKALIPDVEAGAASGKSVLNLAVKDIIPNTYQPRREINPEKLKDLVESIKEKGVVQPILVRPKGVGKYELIAGERRFQAVQLAGFGEIPAIIREVDDREALEIALIENIQREDLNPIDEAMGYHQLVEEFGMTQADVAKRVGKERSTLTNVMRLLKLPVSVQTHLKNGQISAGHARALLSLPTQRAQEKMSERVIKNELTVRDTEKLVKRETEDAPVEPAKLSKDAQLQRVEEQIQQHLQTKISIKKRGQKGRLVVEFYSWDDLERLISRMGISIRV